MIGERIDAKHLNTKAASELLCAFSHLKTTPKCAIAVAGESGSGKTHMAAALASEFEANGQKVLLLHMDDFFKLPPAQNHQNRLSDLNSVGPNEVDIPRLTSIVTAFKNNTYRISSPLVYYYEDRIEEQQHIVSNVDVLIIEGTYAFYVDHLDFHLFMTRTHEQTRELRALRNRGNESNDPFIENVLAIEHQLVTAKREKADAWIDYHFNLKYHV